MEARVSFRVLQLARVFKLATYPNASVLFHLRGSLAPFLLQAGPDRKHHTIIIIITITMSIIVVIIIISIIIIEPLCKYLAPGQKEGPRQERGNAVAWHSYP